MKTRPPLPDGPFLVVGLARSGQAIARLLAACQEKVIGVDSGSPEGAEALTELGVEVRLDLDQGEIVRGAGTVVKSPGVPHDSPVIDAARRQRIQVTGELELAWRLLPNRFVAVTGTNGKTTVTELIAHILRGAGEEVAVAGNVGTPLASLVGEIGPETTVVCECSSFQLEDSEGFAPDCAVLLNLSPDHLDRHGTLDAYLAAKLRIFDNQGRDDIAIFNGDLDHVDALRLGGSGSRVSFCTGGAGCDVSLHEGEIRWRGEPLLRAEQLRLLGPHNVANAMAGAAAALSIGVESGAVIEGLRTFEAVPHRLEPVAALDGVLFVNDSKATNPAAAVAAIRSFPGGVHLILGGSLKGGGFEALAEPVADRCIACYLIGEAADQLEADLAPAAARGVILTRCGGLAEAVEAAAREATAGQIVLLAPACASFDSFESFEQRGDAFRALVQEIG